MNVLDTVASQYANSPILMALLNNIAAYLDPTVDFDNFYDIIWNINTAEGYGLDVWGRIVGVGRAVKTTTTYQYFGFAEALGTVPLTKSQPFGQAPFFSGVSGATKNLYLLDDIYRRLIITKAMFNISNGSVPAINALLLYMFGVPKDGTSNPLGTSGQVWCTDDGNMAMTYTFSFTIDDVAYAILTQSGAFPKPAGVTLTIVQI